MTYVCPTSPQERKISPQDFINLVKDAQMQPNQQLRQGPVDYVIAAFRYSPWYGNLGGDAYFAAFVAAGWTFNHYFVFGNQALYPGYPNGTSVVTVPPRAAGLLPTPSNLIASQLRTAWGIV